MQIEAVLFDVDDTLYSTTEFSEKARRNALRAMLSLGVKVELETLYNELLEVIAEFSSNYGNHFDKLLLRLKPAALDGLNQAFLTASAVIAYHETKKELTPFDGVIELLEFLKDKKIIIGVITDGLRIKQAEKLLRLGVYPYLDKRAVFISEQMGIGKPNKKLFLKSADSLGILPSRILFVGDSPELDIDPASAVGMLTARVNFAGKNKCRLSITPPTIELHKHYNELVRFIRSKN